MNEMISNNKNESMTMIEHHKRHGSIITKSLFQNDNNLNTQIRNRIKRKASLTNSNIIHETTKKFDIVKSTEFESKDPNHSINLNLNLTENSNNNFDQENDFDDYADRIFNYLDETYTKQTSSLSKDNINQVNISSQSTALINSSNNGIKPFLCTFCPYFAQNILEFQTHIAKHTEKNFRCLLCNCMYKYRRDCVTHMKRKHSNAVIGSISQYIQKINSTMTNTNRTQLLSSSSTPSINRNDSNSLAEPKRYGCPYCSLMTKSTSSIYKHQSRKHGSFPRVVHKYSTDDSNTRNLVAVLKQKSIKKPTLRTIDDEATNKQQNPQESLNSNNSYNSLKTSSSLSLVHHSTESVPLVNRHRCAASQHVTAHNIHSSNGRLSKLFQCCLCSYRARHRSNVVRHVKKIHTIGLDKTNSSTALISHESNSQSIENPSTDNTNHSDENSDKLIIDHDEKKTNPNEFHFSKMPTYTFNTTVQAPLIVNKPNNNYNSTKSYADIHLSIDIFLPKKQKINSLDSTISDCSNNEDNPNDNYSDEDATDDDDKTKLYINSLNQQNLCNSPLYKPHKCCRCFYRSNWKTDMLHHIRLKHHLNHPTKSDYITMNFDLALRSFSNYEKTFGKVLKNRLLLSKVDYIDCTWEELKSKLFTNENEKQTNRLSSSSIEQAVTMNK